MSGPYSVVLFYSTSAAFRLEGAAKMSGLDIKLIPVPRHLSSDCGICLRFRSYDRKVIEEILNKNKIEYEDIHDLS